MFAIWFATIFFDRRFVKREFLYEFSKDKVIYLLIQKKRLSWIYINRKIRIIFVYN